MGFILQTVLLLAFIYASRLSFAAAAKPIVIAFAIVAMGWLLWRAAQLMSKAELIAVCAALAIGYMVAFHAVGFLWLPGLLKDLDGFSWAYARSVVAVVVVLLVVYAVTATAMSWVQTLGHKEIQQK